MTGAIEVFKAEASTLERSQEVVIEQPSSYGCSLCRDVGYQFTVNGKGDRFANVCICRQQVVHAARMKRAGIFGKYQTATFENFLTGTTVDPSITLAARACRRMVEELYAQPEPLGVLLTGPCGVGKTHLAAAMIVSAMRQYNATGRLWDVADLLLQVKRTFSRGNDADESESTILQECADVDVLVLDEMGGERLTDWAYSEISLLLNKRYNANTGRGRLTVITTNYENLGAGEGRGGRETLGDRIGARMWSRLQEMCRVVDMTGDDYRRKR